MAESPVQILFIDDDEDDFILVRDLFEDIEDAQFELTLVQDFDQGMTTLLRHEHDVCFVDYRLGEKDGVTFVREAKERGAALPIILLTGQGDHAVDVAAMEAGAADFLDKSQLTPPLLERSVRYGMHAWQVEAQRARLLSVARQQATQLRHLATKLTQAEQQERRRVAQTLHDHLQQLLVAAKMRVDLLQGMIDDEKVRSVVFHVDDLLAESIASSRSLTVQLSPPVLHDRGLVPALEWLARQYETEHKLPVTIQAPEDGLGMLDGHLRDFLFQSVRELLFNVVKHAQAEQAEVDVTLTEENHVQVTVVDSGQGCDQDMVLRGESSEGFGLFQMRQRIEFLGGWFHMHTTPKNGCEVRLTVPLQSRENAAGEPTEMAKGAETGSDAAEASETESEDERLTGGQTDEPPMDKRILLVDDHEILREGIAGLLQEQPGVEVVGEASDGQKAVDLTREIHPDVVVMDVSMPVMNGIDATRIIKQEMPATRVVGLSMHVQADMASAMRDAGAAAYLTKGGPVEDLVAAIHARGGTSGA